MDQEQLNELLDILQKRLSPSNLKTLVFQVLGNGAYDNLPGNVHDEKCISLLEVACQRQILPRLLQSLEKLSLDIDLSSFSFVGGSESSPLATSDPSIPVEPAQTPFIEFANRTVEWERVVLYPHGVYYLFDGPAGYGKTALLQKLQKEFDRRNWRCIYISLETYITFSEVVSKITDMLQLESEVYTDPHRTGLAFGTTIAHKEDGKKGLILLFDMDHVPLSEAQETLAILMKQFIPGIWEALSEDLRFFINTPDNFRVVLAGRGLTSIREDFDLPYDINITQLKPFDYRVVQDISAKYLENRFQSSEHRDEFAAHLLFYSGGHPRCMVRIMQLFERQRLPVLEFFARHREDVKLIAYEEGNWVRSSIASRWRGAFDVLCIYRRFDSDLIKQLMGEGRIWQGLGEDAQDTVANLLRCYLVSWRMDSAYKHLSDDITRRLLTIRLRYDVSTGEVADDYRQARHFCLNRLANIGGELRHIWALEALFSYLQANVEYIDTLEGRHSLRHDFFDQELPLTLTRLVGNQDPRSECVPFKELLVKDWEFRFVLNYYLRDAMYTDEMYQAIIEKVSQFPAQQVRRKPC